MTPLTYIPSDINGPKLLTPAHLLYGKRVIFLPHPVVNDEEIIDSDYTESALQKRAKVQTLILKHFQKPYGNWNS